MGVILTLIIPKRRAGQQAEATLPRNYTILTQNVLKTFYYPPGNSTRGTQNRSGSR